MNVDLCGNMKIGKVLHLCALQTVGITLDVLSYLTAKRHKYIN